MSERPQARLVSRKRYVRVMGKRVSLITLGTTSTIVGAWLLLCAFIEIFDLSGDRPASLTVRDLLIGAALSACAVVVGIMMVKGTMTEAVGLITSQNAHLLPPKDSLVRASDLPPSQQQDELLRVAQYGKETPPEQLLRAGEESRKDV